MNNGRSLAEVLWGYLIAGLLLAVAYVLEGYVFTQLWHWFVVPQFGVAELSLAIAIGLALTVGFVATQLTDTSRLKMKTHLYFLYARPVLVFVLGWIVSQWVS